MEADATANTAHVETLGKLNQDYIDAVSKSAVRRFEQILSDDFLNTNADGTLVNRAQFLAQIAIGTGTGGRLVVISSGAIEIRPMAVNICCLPYRSASLPM